ncbi:MAG: hypothetical protein K0T01_1110 [Acidimicrobiia bacterium]|nr:hypothetical protein [Acidimicrobiia bacterium]
MIKTADFGSAARIGLLATVPFLVMELVFNGANRISMIPPEYLLGITFLFAILWALPTGFLAMLRPLLTGRGSGDSPISILIRLVVVVALGALWVAFIADQWPCFTGVPNCD